MVHQCVVIFTCILATVPALYCLEQLCITEAPPEVKFTTQESLRSALLADVFSSVFGYTIPKSLKWKGLLPVNPLMKPESLVIMEISGLGTRSDFHLDGTCFPLENEGDVEVGYWLLEKRTKERYSEKNPVVVIIPTSQELHLLKAEYPDIFKNVLSDPEQRLKAVFQDPELRFPITDGSFNMSDDVDKDFLLELGTVRQILSQLPLLKHRSTDGVPDIFWFQLKSVGPVIRAHGEDSFNAKEALRVLKQIINEVTNGFQKQYDWQSVVAVIMLNEVISMNAPLTRRSRNLLAVETTGGDIDSINLAPEWSSDFPVIFAIITFVMVLFALSLLGISVAMWHMDPGRDSIIYRMTSQRMKKD